MKKEYKYDATVLSVYDGDTITVEIDLGFHVKIIQPLRLFDINAPEVTGIDKPKGICSRDWLRCKLPIGTKIIIETIKDAQEKYGRYLANIYLGDEFINESLVSSGNAKIQKY